MSRRSGEPAAAVPPSLAWSLGLLGLASCGTLEPVATHEAVTDPTALYTALTLDRRAINLALEAPYHAIQLTATPRNGLGAAMPELPAPTFRLASAGDSTRLRVTSAGQVTALTVGSQIAVIAELVTPGPVRHADTALVNVTLGAPPVLDSFSVDPTSPGDTLWPLGAADATLFLHLSGLPIPSTTLTPQAWDPAGQAIPGLVVEYASLDPARATVDRWTGRVNLLRPGSVRMVARTTAYGVTAADTALFRVTWPLEGVVLIRASSTAAGVFVPDEIRLLPGGLLYWRTERNDTVDITFDDPTNVTLPPAPLCDFFQLFGFPEVCGVGDMVVPGDLESFNGFRIRRFPVAGVYRYRSIRTGAVGQIVVTDQVPAEASGP